MPNQSIPVHRFIAFLQHSFIHVCVCSSGQIKPNRNPRFFFFFYLEWCGSHRFSIKAEKFWCLEPFLDSLTSQRSHDRSAVFLRNGLMPRVWRTPFWILDFGHEAWRRSSRMQHFCLGFAGRFHFTCCWGEEGGGVVIKAFLSKPHKVPNVYLVMQ